jgi:hypothetical protein
MLVPGDCSCCLSAETDSTDAADSFTVDRGAAVNVKLSADAPVSGVGGAGLHTISAAVAVAVVVIA